MNLIKEPIQKQLLTRVLKNSCFANVPQKRCSQKFCNIYRKAPVLESLFNKVAAAKQLPEGL